jgi:SPP1 family phage portal protein
MEVEFDSEDLQEDVFLGRSVIYTSRTADQINENTIPDIVNGAMERHRDNSREIEYLFRYFRGDQPILYRQKVVRPEINNRLVINNAFSIVRNAAGYFLGEPIQYTAKESADNDSVKQLNAFMDSENKADEDMSLGEDASICGTAYRLVSVDDDGEEDESPFEIPTLEPWNTFVVYSSKAGHKPLLGVTYSKLLDDNGNTVGTSYVIYDNKCQYQYAVKGVPTTKIQPKDMIAPPKPHFLGDVPIVEYPNNRWRIGDFEIVMTVLNAINDLHSDRMNSIQQVVDAVLVFIGCHLKTKEENAQAGEGGISDYQSLKEYGAIELPSADGQKADVKYVSSSVNQNDAEVFAQTLADYAYAICGIPDRKQKGGGTGDTGDAVYLRNGFESLELVARVKERSFKKSEHQSLRMVCKILKVFNSIDLKPMQVDIKFIRNRTNNLVNKSQALSNLHSTGLFAPEDEIQLIGITDDPKQMAERGQAYKDAQAQKAADLAVKAQKSTQPTAKAQSAPTVKTLGKGDNPDDTTDGEE